MNYQKECQSDYEWSLDKMLEIEFQHKDDFLKIKETLTRIGIASSKEKILYQSAHILHKRGKYYIVHFKELFALDGKLSNIDNSDIERRNAIAKLLDEWKLLIIVDKSQFSFSANNQFKVISFKDKQQWKLIAKYQLGT